MKRYERVRFETNTRGVEAPHRTILVRVLERKNGTAFSSRQISMEALRLGGSANPAATRIQHS